MRVREGFFTGSITLKYVFFFSSTRVRTVLSFPFSFTDGFTMSLLKVIFKYALTLLSNLSLESPLHPPPPPISRGRSLLLIHPLTL